MQLNPSDERALQLYSLLLAWTSEDQAHAVRAVQHALDLDPLSQQMNAFTAWIYLWVNDFARANEQARKTLELFPGMLQAYYALGLAELSQARHAEAIAALEKAVAISPDPMSVTYLGCALARVGRIEATISVLDNLLQRSQRSPRRRRRPDHRESLRSRPDRRLAARSGAGIARLRQPHRTGHPECG